MIPKIMKDEPEPKDEADENVSPPKDEYGKRGVKSLSDPERINLPDDNSVSIAKQEVKALPPTEQAGGARVGNSPILQEMNKIQVPVIQVNNEVFQEIPEEYCGQLYNTGLECVWSLKNKGFPVRELPEKRVKEQGHIIYEIMKKNQISFAHIDLFMLGAGMISDWKYMDSYAAEQKHEEKMAEAEKT